MHLQAFQTQVHCRLRTARQSFRLVPYAYAIVLPINPSRSAGKYWLAVVKMGAPCGVPCFTGIRFPFSRTPVRSHRAISANTRPIRDSVLQEAHHPLVVDGVKERTYIDVQYPPYQCFLYSYR